MEEAIKNYEYPIPMLDEENYDQWQMAVYGLLFIRDLWDVVNPDLHKQSDDDGSLGDEREKKKQEMAAKLIVSGYIPGRIIKSLRLAPLSAREMWIVLRHRFGKSAFFRLLDAFRAIHSPTPGETAIEIIFRIRNAFQEIETHSLTWEQHAIFHCLVTLADEDKNIIAYWSRIPISKIDNDGFTRYIDAHYPISDSAKNPTEVAGRTKTKKSKRKSKDKK